MNGYFGSLNFVVVDIYFQRENMQNMTLGEQINKTCDEVCQVRFFVHYHHYYYFYLSTNIIRIKEYIINTFADFYIVNGDVLLLTDGIE